MFAFSWFDGGVDVGKESVLWVRLLCGVVSVRSGFCGVWSCGLFNVVVVWLVCVGDVFVSCGGCFLV